MAVPKKRVSKSKTRSRKANWKRKAFHQSMKAISLTKSSLNAISKIDPSTSIAKDVVS